MSPTLGIFVFFDDLAAGSLVFCEDVDGAVSDSIFTPLLIYTNIVIILP